MSVPSPIIARPKPIVAPTVLKEFLRACGCTESVIHTIGDEAQARRIETTRCSFCREATAPRYGRGRGSSR